MSLSSCFIPSSFALEVIKVVKRGVVVVVDGEEDVFIYIYIYI
jgi:hypothetical protein